MSSLGEGAGRGSRERSPLSPSYRSVTSNLHLEPVHYSSLRPRSTSPTAYNSSDSGYDLSPIAVKSASITADFPSLPSSTSTSPPPRFGFSPPLRRREEEPQIDGSSVDIVINDVPSITDLENNVNAPIRCGEPFHYPIPPPGSDPWEVANDLVKANDKDMCERWKEETDKQLFFAGLFANVVVAFIVVSYQLLQPSPMDIQKANYALFLLILREYQVNGTIPSPDFLQLSPSPNNYHPPSAALEINATWFLSMTLALSSVLIGTVCLQWIREYERDPRLNPKRAFAIRQMRWDGLQHWKVPLIISGLTILLQSALLLFFWGLLEFLWGFNSIVTVINSVVIATVLFFMTATICVPALQTVLGGGSGRRGYQAPYKSPQARVVAIAAVWVALKVVVLLQFFSGRSRLLEEKRMFLERILKAKGWTDWTLFDNEWQGSRMDSVQDESCDISRGLARLGNTHIHTMDGISALYHLLRRVHPITSYQTLQKLARTSGQSNRRLESHSPGNPLILMDENYRDILADLHSAFLLGLIVGSGQDPMHQEMLKVYQCELYIRIASYGVGRYEGPPDPPWGPSISVSIPLEKQDEMGRFVNKLLSERDCAINPFVGNDDYRKLPEIMKHELIVVFRKFLGNTCKLHGGLWEIVKPLVLQIVDDNIPPGEGLLDEMILLNGDLLRHYKTNVINVSLPPIARSSSGQVANDVSRAPIASSSQDPARLLSPEQQRVRDYITAIRDRKPQTNITNIRLLETFQALEKACCDA